MNVPVDNSWSLLDTVRLVSVKMILHFLLPLLPVVLGAESFPNKVPSRVGKEKRFLQSTKNVFEWIMKKNRPAYETSLQCPAVAGELPCGTSIERSYENNACKTSRKEDIKKNRKLYKLTRYGEMKIIEFPFEAIPWLNQTIAESVITASKDDVDATYLAKSLLYQSSIVKKIAETLLQAFATSKMETHEEYVTIYDMANAIIKQLNQPGEYHYSLSLTSSAAVVFPKLHF